VARTAAGWPHAAVVAASATATRMRGKRIGMVVFRLS